MLVPYNVDVPMQRWPIANWVIIAVTAMISAGLLANGASLEDSSVWVLRPGEEFSALGLLGSLFAHGSFMHLLGNMFFLFCFGNAVNAKIGQLQFVALYLGIGVLDGLIWLALGNSEGVLGASGAVMGILGALVVFYPRNDVSVFYWFGLLWQGTFSISAYWVVAAYVGLDLLGVVSEDDRVAHVSHVVGAALGAGAASALLLTGLIVPGPREHTLLQMLKLQKRTPEQEVVELRTRVRGVDGPVRRGPRRAPELLRGPAAPTAAPDLPPIPLADEPPPGAPAPKKPIPASPRLAMGRPSASGVRPAGRAPGGSPPPRNPGPRRGSG